MTPFQQVKEFHETFGHPVNSEASFPDDGRISLRLGLILEELGELTAAIAGEGNEAAIVFHQMANACYSDTGNPQKIVAEETGDLVEVADALGDMIYVINGMALELGIDLDKVVNEIHRSNMSKLGADGKPIYREDGKIMKGPNYSEPNLSFVLEGVA